MFTDSSVLIPLLMTDNLLLLKKIYKKIKITDKVKEELLQLNNPGKTSINSAISSWVKIISTSTKTKEIKRFANQENISIANASSIIFANKNGTILTNDLRIRIYGQKN